MHSEGETYGLARRQGFGTETARLVRSQYAFRWPCRPVACLHVLSILQPHFVVASAHVLDKDYCFV